MSVYKVERKVDTVIVEMDSSAAEALMEILGHVIDHTGMQPAHELFCALDESGKVRWPSQLHKVHIDGENEQIHLLEAIGSSCRRHRHAHDLDQRLGI